MPASDLPFDRRAALKALLATGPAPNQQTLVRALAAQGFAATQSSISRDLREIGAIKTSAGYALPGTPDVSTAQIDDVMPLVRELTPAGPNLLVIRTAIGAAQRVALALDRSAWPEVAGTVAGDDTIFAATPNAASQRRMIHRIEQTNRTTEISP